ncbi:hypothetical protein ACS0TY_008871 [Phlomoides rotata]
MALSFTRFPWLSFGGKEKEQVPNGSGINSMGEWGFGFRGEKLYSMKGGGGGGGEGLPSSRKSRRKWKSREERSTRIDREYDVVLVPSDGVSLSGSESDDSDWSIGWMEPHAPDFQSDDVADDDSFAVLVPCYRNDCKKMEVPSVRFLGAVKNLPNGYSAGGKEYMEQWLSSLQNF